MRLRLRPDPRVPLTTPMLFFVQFWGRNHHRERARGGAETTRSFQHWALTGQGSSQVSPSQPGVQEQEPLVGLQAAPLVQVQLSLQFRPHVPLGHGRVQSRPCHPKGRERGHHLSTQAQHGFLRLPPALDRAFRPNHHFSDCWVRTHMPCRIHSEIEIRIAVQRAGARVRVSCLPFSLFLLWADDPTWGREPAEVGGAISAQSGVSQPISGPFVFRTA